MLETILSLFLFAPGSVDNYTQVIEAFKKIVAENPSTAQIFSLGMSDSGQAIIGMRIAQGNSKNTLQNIIVGTHHGNEYGSTAVAVGAAEAFAKQPIAGQTIFVIPVLNISGYNARNRYEKVGSMTIDPNRDYPGPCGTQGPFKSKATRALAQFIAEQSIVTSATLHTYSPAVLYPWGISTRDTSTLYDNIFINLAMGAAKESNYAYGNSTKLLYAADGTYEDYAFWKHGVWSLLFEMGSSHSPSTSDMQKMVAVNVPGIRRFFEQAPTTRAANHAFTGRCDYSVLSRVHLE